MKLYPLYHLNMLGISEYVEKNEEGIPECRKMNQRNSLFLLHFVREVKTRKFCGTVRMDSNF